MDPSAQRSIQRRWQRIEPLFKLDDLFVEALDTDIASSKFPCDTVRYDKNHSQYNSHTAFVVSRFSP